jgi:hypothetical protein
MPSSSIWASNLRFASRLSKKQAKIFRCIQLNQSEHLTFEDISIKIVSGASNPKQSTKAKAFQLRLDTIPTSVFSTRRLTSRNYWKVYHCWLETKTNCFNFYFLIFLYRDHADRKYKISMRISTNKERKKLVLY